MVEQLSDEQKDELKEAFLLFDAEGKQVISTKELGTVMRVLGRNYTEEELEVMIKEVDPDEKGTLTFSDFVQLMVKELKEATSEELLIDAFKEFDQDKDGIIPAIELKSAMKTIGEKCSDEEIEKMVDLIDLKGNKNIEYVEFIRRMMSK